MPYGACKNKRGDEGSQQLASLVEGVLVIALQGIQLGKDLGLISSDVCYWCGGLVLFSLHKLIEARQINAQSDPV